MAKNTIVESKFEDTNQLVFLDGKDVSNCLYTDQISILASQIAVHKPIREKLVEIQRDVANNNSVIMDGRDIGSVVLPMADFKFYLDADVNIRADRRYKELVSKGEKTTFEEVLEDLKLRDIKDKTRNISPLIVSEDAIVIDSTYMNVDEVVDKFLEIINRS